MYISEFLYMNKSFRLSFDEMDESSATLNPDTGDLDGVNPDTDDDKADISL
jgi:hypothetical protein